MASVSAFSICKPNSPLASSSHPSQALSSILSKIPNLKLRTQFKNSSINVRSFLRPTKLRAVAEEVETLVPEKEPVSVSVSVSPSDVLTMFFQAEGTMNDLAIPAVTRALEEVEGIADLKVQVVEGIASVELKKETTVQATGVASNLLEIIQGSGFKLQTLNLSFEDEEDLS